MMRTPIALLLGLAAFSSAAGATFTSPEMGLTFKHPDTWKVVKKKGDTRISIPTSAGAAQLLIFPRSYNADVQLWLDVEKQMAVQQKQTVDAQTQEEIMGVPLLLTRVRYVLNGENMMGLAGLVYSATTKKMLFRLTSSESTFDEAERAWREALQTMTTLDGKLPKPEEPGREITPEEAKRSESPVKVTPIKAEVKNRGKVVKGRVTTATKAAGVEVVLCVPKGWTAEAREDGTVSVKHPSLAKPLTVTVLSSLDSDEAGKTLAKAAAESLNQFTAVRLREDREPKKNDAGANVSIVWREGTVLGDKGLLSCEAVGVSGDFYWFVRYAEAFPEPAKKDRKAMEALFKAMSVEPAQ